ncbi:MAG: Trm112 family protein [Pseudomonadota bacterium]
MEEKLLDIACCPLTHQALRKARSEELAALNRAIAEGTVSNNGGAPVTEALPAGLVTQDGQRIYPVVDGLVSLLPDSAISLSDIESQP